MEHSGTLGDRISQAMKRRGLKNPDVARRLGVHVVTVSKWRTDRQMPDDGVLARLATLLQVSPSWLRYGTEAPVLREGRAGYATDDVALANAILGGDLLRMRPDVYRIAYELLDQMQAAGLTRMEQNAIESWLTELSAGLLTPGHALPTALQEEEARDAVAFVRRLYERRGVSIPVEYPPLSEDPDAISGAALERQLAGKKGGKKAG